MKPPRKKFNRDGSDTKGWKRYKAWANKKGYLVGNSPQAMMLAARSLNAKRID